MTLRGNLGNLETYLFHAKYSKYMVQ